MNRGTRVFQAATLGLALFSTGFCLDAILAATWDGGGGVDMDWSTPTNWSDDADPAGKAILFNATASSSSQGATTNVVDTSYSVGSLQYALPNTAGSSTSLHHTTVIDSAATLTVAGPLTIGIDSGGPGTGFATTGSVTFRGSVPGTGELVVNAGGNHIAMGANDGSYNNGARRLTIDMRDLDSFSATTDNYFYLAAGHLDPVTVYLPDDAQIVADGIAMASWNDTDRLFLGQQGVLRANQITLCGNVPGAGQQNNGGSVLEFRSGLAGPSVEIADRAGMGRADMIVGLGGNINGDNTGTADFSDGSVDAMLGELIIGQGYPHLTVGNDGIGTWLMAAGTVDATTVRVGYTAPGTRAGSDPSEGHGTLTLDGPGTFTADALILSDQQSDALAEGEVNLSTGTLAATTITRGTGPGTADLNWSGGTIANKPGSDLSVDGVQLVVSTSADHAFDIQAGQVATISAPISGGTGDIVKTGDGTLLVESDANTYNSTTVVEAGLLGGDGTIPGTLWVQGGGTASPGGSPGELQVGALDLDGTLLIELGGTDQGSSYDHLVVDGVATLGGVVDVDLFGGFVPTIGESFDVLTATGGIVDDGYAFDFSATAGIVGWTTQIVPVGGGTEVLRLNAVPEPTSAALLLLAVGCLIFGRRRRVL